MNPAAFELAGFGVAAYGFCWCTWKSVFFSIVLLFHAMVLVLLLIEAISEELRTFGKHLIR